MTPPGKPIVVFFTHGVSLELWETRGMFSREVNFYRALAQQAGPVWFFTYGKNDVQYTDQLGPDIRLFPKRLPVPNFMYGILLPFLHWRQMKAARLIRIHQMGGAIPALLTRLFFRKPLWVRCGYQWSLFLQQMKASPLKQRVAAWIESVTYRQATQIIVTTHPDAQYVHKRYAISPDNILIISNYIDTDLFKPLPVEKKARRVCTVGRFVEQKNFVNLVKAVAGLDVELVVYGEGELRKEIEKTAREQTVHLSLPGNIANTELPKRLNECELFVLPSLYEGNPKVLLEAMSCGLPIVGTRVAGIDTVLEQDKNGVLCDTDPDALKTAIASLLAHPEKQALLGTHARETIVRTCSLTHAIDTEVTSYATHGV